MALNKLEFTQVIDSEFASQTELDIVSEKAGDWQGIWSAQNYIKGDIVRYTNNNAIYECILDNVSSEVPTNATYWDLVLDAFNEVEHRALDQLVHNVAETSYTEIIKVLGKVTEVIIWESISKIKKIREHIITRVNNKVSQEVTKHYDTDGTTVLETMTNTFNRNLVDNKVSSIGSVLT